jgi:hypothetical protein
MSKNKQQQASGKKVLVYVANSTPELWEAAIKKLFRPQEFTSNPSNSNEKDKLYLGRRNDPESEKIEKELRASGGIIIEPIFFAVKPQGNGLFGNFITTSIEELTAAGYKSTGMAIEAMDYMGSVNKEELREYMSQLQFPRPGDVCDSFGCYAQWELFKSAAEELCAESLAA